MRRGSEVTPVGALVRGIVAGVLGTAAMDTVWYRRYRSGGGDGGPLEWEFASGLSSWDAAPAPAQVGKRLYEGFVQKELDGRHARLVTNLVHWGTGVAWGALYGLLAGSMPRRTLVAGLPFGAGVWATSYLVLARAGVYKPMREYDRATLWKDLSAHLVFGAGTAATFAALSPAGS
ncbi:MAG TPA: hypothetical protein VEM93_02775 [Actinomycetota bacterium]|nr:hypothetical protein [Actinomycetota bacterium]